MICCFVVFHRWQADAYSPCSDTCDGIRVRNVYCRCEASNGSAIEGTDADCQRDDINLKPNASETCGVACPQYNWVTGPWRSCSVDCGSGGQQDRTVYCQITTATTVSNRDEQECLQADVARQIGPKPTTQRACDPVLHCRYTVSSWGECSNSCGGGRRARTLTCDRLNSDGTTTAVPLQACENDETITDETPTTTENCNIRPCCQYNRY